MKLSGFGWEVDRASCPTEVVDSLKFSERSPAEIVRGSLPGGGISTPSERLLIGHSAMRCALGGGPHGTRGLGAPDTRRLN